MEFVVQKYGGTSVGSIERIKLVAPRPDDFATVVKRLSKGL